MLNRIKRAKTLTCTMKVSRKNQARRPFAAARQSGASHRVYRQAQCPASRRECIAAGAALLCCPNAAHAFETDAKTVANSILSAYGLPTIKDSKGYKEYNRDVDGFTLLVPKDWIARANTQRAGAYISNFQTNDKAVIEVMPTRLDMDIVDMAVRAAVSPGSLEDTSKVSIPPRDKVKVETREVDGRQYTYLRFPSTTLTNSGYDIRRQNLAAAIERKGKTYVLVASARGDQFNQQKEQQLAYVAASFRVN